MTVCGACLLLLAWKDRSEYKSGKTPDRLIVPATIVSIAVAAIAVTALTKAFDDLSDKVNEIESYKAAKIADLCSGINEGGMSGGTEAYEVCADR